MANNSFLGITYESWQETCEMFLSPVNNFRLRQSFSMYIQDYPFTKLTLKDKQEIESLNFILNTLKVVQFFLTIVYCFVLKTL